MSILASLVQPQQGFGMSDVIRMYKQVQRAPDKQAEFNRLAEQSPQLKQTIEYIQKNGKDPMTLAAELAKQNGYDLDWAIALLK